MDYGMLIISIVLIVISYLVSIKKQTWLLAGFNEKMIKNKSLLSTITGIGFFLPLGIIVLFNSAFNYANEGTVLVVSMLVLLTVVYIFINKRLLD